MSCMAGFHKLPTEIFVRIFECGGRATLHNDGLPFAVLVSHVCRYWRRIATGTPSVWCHVPVHPLRVGLTEYFLENSATMPLEIYLHFTKILNAKEAMLLLLEHRHRWASISLRAGNGTGVFLVVSTLRAAEDWMRQLRHFEISVIGKPGTVGRLPELFRDTPPRSLQSVRMHGVSFNLRSAIFTLTNLTHLDLSFLPRDMGTPTFTSFRDLFGTSSKLKYLKLAGVFPKLIDSVQYGEIDLPALEILELIMKQDEDYVPLFFSIICAPALKTLRFESKWNTTWDGFEQAIPIISAKFAGLQTLELFVATPVAFGKDICPDFFACFPELRVLALGAFHDYLLLSYILQPWIAVLGGDQDDGAPLWDEVWPRLELLAIRTTFDTNGDDEDEEQSLEDAIDLIGSLRMSLNQPFDVSLTPVFEDFVIDPLDTD